MHLRSIDLLGVFVIFSFYLVFALMLGENNRVYSCGGTFLCGSWESECRDISGNPCGTCGSPGSSCSFQQFCNNSASLDRSCGAAGAVCAYGCGVGSCMLYDGCYDDSGGSTPTSSASNPCAPDPLGVACGSGYCCGSDVCASGGCCPAGYPYVCNGSCSSTPCTTTSTPTPVPQTCTPNEFIRGTYCISSTSCYDIYCNSSGTGTVNRTYSGDTCSSCGSGSSATPVPTTTSGGGGCGLCNGVECCEPSVCTGAPLSCYSFEPPPGGCWIGSDPYGTCQGSACVQVAGCGFSSCFSDVDCSCGDNICQAYETSPHVLRIVQKP